MKKIYIPLLVGIIITSLLFLNSKKEKRNFIQPHGYGFKKSIVPSTTEVKNFALLDHMGKFQELFRNNDKEYIIIIPLNFSCSSSMSYINKILEEKKKESFLFLFIYPDEKQDRNFIIQETKNSQINFPVLLDPSQTVTKQLGLKSYNEFKIISTKSWNYLTKIESNKNLIQLNNELEPALKNNSCEINFTIHKNISYQNQIAPILINKCITCHSKDGKIPPFFDSYEKIFSWKEMSRETIMSSRMPPISFDPIYGEIHNDISLTQIEKQLLIQWYDEGARKENQTDPVKSYKIKPNSKSLKKENFLYSASMPSPHTIPPGGEIVYKFFQIGEAVPFDLWVKGYKTITSNRRQLHHESLFIASRPLNFYEKIARKKFGYNESEAIKKHQDGDVANYISNIINGFDSKNFPDNFIKIQTYGAGKKDETFFPKGTGLFIPKGSYLILEKHYMGTGRIETEQSSIEFYGTKNHPPHMKNIRSKIIGSIKFEIPANVKNYEVHTPFWSPKNDIKILTFLGHLHMRGQSVKIELHPLAGNPRTIFSIPNFYYGWQTGAALKLLNPISVKSTDKLKAVCNYDNSKSNPFNPDPNKNVFYGQRVDRSEMCKMNITYINI